MRSPAGPVEGLLVLISAPSGTGKTSLVAGLTEADANIVVSISHTTRPRRSKEQDGVDYHFVDRAAFQKIADAGGFLEHAHVHGHLYGTAAETIEDIRAKGRDIVLEIDWQGAAQVRKLITDAVSVFVLPPSKAALEERLIARGQDARNVIEARLRDAQAEMTHHLQFDYLLVNDDFHTALTDLTAIVRAERLTSERASQARQGLITDLLS